MGEELVFWNVDTQYDFMKPDGKLPVGENHKGAEEIEPALKTLRNVADRFDVTVVNTADWHTPDSKELSDDPDYQETFPPHCMAGTGGAEYVWASNPWNPMKLDWRKEVDYSELEDHNGDFVIYKDAFDVFAGEPEAPHTDAVLDTLEPEKVVVYGVATDVCVDYAVDGLLDRGHEVYVVEDAIKGLDPARESKTLESWEKNGAEIGDLDELLDYMVS